MTPRDDDAVKPVDPAAMPLEESMEVAAQGEDTAADPGDMVEEVVEVEVGAEESEEDESVGDESVDEEVLVEASAPVEDVTFSAGDPPVSEYIPADVAAVTTELEGEDTGGSPVPQAGAAVAAGMPRQQRVLSGGWTMGLLLCGLGLIAACVLIPQGDETRRLMYEREKLRMDLEQVQKQVATNEDFLKKVQSDPTLAQRLAQRQMKLVPAGSQVLEVENASPTAQDKSPFLIVSVPPPQPLAPYRAPGGWFSDMCRNGRSQLYMIGGGLMLVAAGLVLGASGTRD